VFASEVLRNADWIAYVTRLKPKEIQFLPELFAEFREHSDAKIVVFGRTAEFLDDVPKLALSFGRLNGLDTYLATRRDDSLDVLNE